MMTPHYDKVSYKHDGPGKESTIIRLDDCDSISADDEAISDSLRSLVLETECILDAIVRLNSTTQPNRECSQRFVPDTYDDFSIGEVICLDDYEWNASNMNPEWSLPNHQSPTKSTNSMSNDVRTSAWYLNDAIDEHSDRSLWLASHSHLTATTDETVCFGVREVVCLQEQEWDQHQKTLASVSRSLSSVTAEEIIFYDEEETPCRRDKAFGRTQTPSTASKSFSTSNTKKTTFSETKDIICPYDDNFISKEGGRNSEAINAKETTSFSAQNGICLQDEGFINGSAIGRSLSNTPWNATSERFDVGTNGRFHDDDNDTTRQVTASGSQISGLTEESGCFDLDEVVFRHDDVLQKRLKNTTSLSISTAATEKSALSYSCNSSDELNKSTENLLCKSATVVQPQCKPEIDRVRTCTFEEISKRHNEIPAAGSRKFDLFTQSLSTMESEKFICSKMKDPLIQKRKDILSLSQSLSTSATEDSVCSSTGTLHQSTSYDASFNLSSSRPIMSSTRYLKLATEWRKQSSSRVPLTRSISSGTGSAFTEKALGRLSERGRISYRPNRSTTSHPSTNSGATTEKEPGAKTEKEPGAKPPKPNVGRAKKSNENSVRVVAPRTENPPKKVPRAKIPGRKQSRALKQEEAILQRLCRPTAAWKSRCAKNSFFGNHP